MANSKASGSGTRQSVIHGGEGASGGSSEASNKADPGKRNTPANRGDKGAKNRVRR